MQVKAQRGSIHDGHIPESIFFNEGAFFMSIDRIVMAVAGAFIILSTLLAVYHSIHWLWFTGFVGLNLLQSAFTGFCLTALLLKKFGAKPGAAFN